MENHEVMKNHEVMVLVKLKVSAVDEPVARLAGFTAIDNAVRHREGDGFNYAGAGGDLFVESVLVEGTELWAGLMFHLDRLDAESGNTLGGDLWRTALESLWCLEAVATETSPSAALPTSKEVAMRRAYSVLNLALRDRLRNAIAAIEKRWCDEPTTEGEGRAGTKWETDVQVIERLTVALRTAQLEAAIPARELDAICEFVGLDKGRWLDGAALEAIKKRIAAEKLN